MSISSGHEKSRRPGVDSAQARLEIAAALIDEMEIQCSEAGITSDASILLLAFYARSDVSERASLLCDGLK